MNVKETNHIDFNRLKAVNKNTIIYTCPHSSNIQSLLFYFK